MAAGMEFGLLGPLTVRRDGMMITVPAGKQRVVLAALLLRANRLVPLDELAEALWGPVPPVSARVTMQNYVMRLRKALGDDSRGRIATQRGGYQLHVDPGELDVSRFEVLLGSAHAAAQDGSWDQAAGQARAALALWRGEPLAAVDSEFLVMREVPRLAELRLRALETRVGADLHLGRHGEVIGELRQLASAHPLRERFYALLMLALYRDGRQGEALAAYQQARGVLIEELGAEPGTELRDLHQKMLTADPALDVPAPARPATSGPSPPVPRELPARIGHFTGRGDELKELAALLDQSGEETPTMVISAIGGTAGVGKTALAVQWAHQVAQRFPDGQLYVNLRGYDPGQPVTATDALARFLRALGVAGRDIPAEEDERAARYRSLLAGKQLLVVLDNAGEAGQVRPLLPGGPGCVVVVTSREPLAGLVARDGAHRLDLDLLPLADAVGLLRALIGDRVDAEPSAAATLAERCARLPLALRVAAELAAARPDLSLAGLAADLAGQRRRLDALEAGGDPQTAVRAVFSWSCRHLDPDAARAFRLAGLHPGASFGAHAAAALTDTTAEQAASVLEVLARAHLVQPAGPGRYGMHDLLRAYAAEQADAIDSEQERRAALTGLFDYYLAATTAAVDALYPAEKHRRPQPPAPSRAAPPPPAPAAAQDWLDTERACLVAVTAHAAAHGWPGHAVMLAANLHQYFQDGGHLPEAQAVSADAWRAAQQTGDLAAQARALSNLSEIDGWQGHYQQAADRTGAALELYRQIGDRAGQAEALHILGTFCLGQRRLEQGAGYLRQALAIFRELGQRLGECWALGDLGVAVHRQGHHAQAAGYFRENLAIARELGDRRTEGIALGNLGEMLGLLGLYQEAEEDLGRGLALCRELGARHAQAGFLQTLGHLLQEQARYQEAVELCQQALALARDMGDRRLEARSLNSLGEALCDAGLPAQARAQHHDALIIAGQIGSQYEQARSHHGLAGSYHATGDDGQARHHWQQALALYTGLGVPEADQVRAQLTAAQDADRGEPCPPGGRSG